MPAQYTIVVGKCNAGLTPLAVNTPLDKSKENTRDYEGTIIQLNTLNWFPNVFTNKIQHLFRTKKASLVKRRQWIINRRRLPASTRLDCVTSLGRLQRVKNAAGKCIWMRAGEGVLHTARRHTCRSHRSSFRPRPPMSKVKVSGYKPARVRWPIWLLWTQITLQYAN